MFVGPVPAPFPCRSFLCLFIRQPQSEQPEILATESSSAFCPGGEGMPGSRHCGGHHAAGKDTGSRLLCPGMDGTGTGMVHSQASSPHPWVPKPERAWLEQAKQCPPGGTAVLSHCWAL